MNINKTSTIILITIIIILGALYIKDKLNFPIAYKVCGIGYIDCHTVAKFEDRESCETTNEKWAWYCDQTDKNNILCRAEKSTFSTGFCD